MSAKAIDLFYSLTAMGAVGNNDKIELLEDAELCSRIGINLDTAEELLEELS